MTIRAPEFATGLQELIHACGIDQECKMHDHILAAYVVNCLEALRHANVEARVLFGEESRDALRKIRNMEE